MERHESSEEQKRRAIQATNAVYPNSRKRPPAFGLGLQGAGRPQVCYVNNEELRSAMYNALRDPYQSSVISKIQSAAVSAGLDIFISYEDSIIELSSTMRAQVQTKWLAFAKQVNLCLLATGMVIVGKKRDDPVPHVVDFALANIAFVETARFGRTYWLEDPAGNAVLEGFNIWVKDPPMADGHLTSPGSRVLDVSAKMRALDHNQQRCDAANSFPCWVLETVQNSSTRTQFADHDEYVVGFSEENRKNVIRQNIQQDINNTDYVVGAKADVYRQFMDAVHHDADERGQVANDILHIAPYQNNFVTPLGQRVTSGPRPTHNPTDQFSMDRFKHLVLDAFGVPHSIMDTGNAGGQQLSAQHNVGLFNWDSTIGIMQSELCTLLRDCFEWANPTILSEYVGDIIGTARATALETRASQEVKLIKARPRRRVTSPAGSSDDTESETSNDGGAPRIETNDEGNLELQDTPEMIQAKADEDDTTYEAAAIWVRSKLKIVAAFPKRPLASMEDFKGMYEMHIITKDTLAAMVARQTGIDKRHFIIGMEATLADAKARKEVAEVMMPPTAAEEAESPAAAAAVPPAAVASDDDSSSDAPRSMVTRSRTRAAAAKSVRAKPTTGTKRRASVDDSD